MVVDIVFGFLGAGKTTFITRVLQQWGEQEKIVVLVNEFGEVGIDGELLASRGGDVLEMPSGCICCTLQADFKVQILDIIQSIHPERIIIEPTGVATISQVRSIVELQIFENTFSRINDILIADATGFMGLYKANRHFVESQVENAGIILLNKCDLVDKKMAMVTRSAISAINPDISVLMTEFGAVDWAEYQMALSAAPHIDTGKAEQEQKLTIVGAVHPHNLVGGGHPHFHEHEDALGYESFGCIYEAGSFNKEKLEQFFREANNSKSGMGEIVRAKGIFGIGEKWILLELASGELSLQPAKKSKQSKVSIIGRELDRKMIKSSLDQCLA